MTPVSTAIMALRHARQDSLISESGLGFPFQGLNRDTNEIRLFKLQPGYRDDPICGSLQTFQIYESPRFRAFSYEWLKDKARYKIFLDDGVIKIRLNLLMFLENYRANMDTEDSVEYLWIDTICIDQEDVLERNHQVQLMSWIFSNAEEVVAWLGPDYDQYSKHKRRSSTDHCVPICRCVTVFGEKMFCSTFWDRLWTQQEMVLAQEVKFMIGRRVITRESAKECFEGGNQWLVHNEPALRAALMDSEDRKSQASFTLLKAIKQFSKKRCHDPRDKVFGLLGMVYDYERIPVNYRLSTHQVFYQAVQAVFTNEDFPNAKFRQNYVVSALVKLGAYMGISYDDAFGACQTV